MVKKISFHERLLDKSDEIKERSMLRFRNFVLTQLKDSLTTFISNFETVNKSDIIDGIKTNIGYASYYYKDIQNYVYNNLYYANQLQYAWFLYTMNDGKALELEVADTVIATQGKFSTSGIGAKLVFDAIEMAYILRDKEKLAYYADIPLTFTEQAGQEDLFFESMLLFYQVLIKGTGTPYEAQGTITEIKKLFDWNEYYATVKTEGFNSEYVWKIIFEMRSQVMQYLYIPVLEIYDAIFHKNQKAFNEAVLKAIESWQSYWTLKYIDENQEEHDHRLEPQGYFALPIIAACAYAYDNGIYLTDIEADYSPDWMIEGRFKGFELLVK